MPGDVPGMGGVSTPADPDYGDSVSVAGTLGSKSDFDRRKKKRYLHGDFIALIHNKPNYIEFSRSSIAIIQKSNFNHLFL